MQVIDCARVQEQECVMYYHPASSNPQSLVLEVHCVWLGSIATRIIIFKSPW